VEFHYCLIILPIFLWMLRKSKLLPISIIIAAPALRFFIYQQHGQVQDRAYWTIIGRIDQFALGMIIFRFIASPFLKLRKRYVVAAHAWSGFKGSLYEKFSFSPSGWARNL